ncbi:MAG: SDR family oxidoreductase [Burkholderiaceae bacterium]|jgi:NAD(P)-dependent dehydrogenase (short-subunit alcohol dehydrogenase family)|nr:SDR family oxidoreductase [Burkholderiaceae bacterium]
MDGVGDISGKIVLVTGASSGIGAHFVKVLARAGGTVAAVARRLDRLEALSAQCRAEGMRVLAVNADVRDRASIFAAVQKVEAEAGLVTVLVNAAGVAVNKAFLAHEERDYDHVIDTNLKGTWNTIQAVARRLIDADTPGVIVNVGSVFGQRIAGNAASYCASKAAVMHLTRALSLELGRHNIRINSLSPGLFQTEMTAHMFQKDGYARDAAKRTPVGRTGRLVDLDGALLLLASDASRFMTGSVVVVDGGLLNSSL